MKVRKLVLGTFQAHRSSFQRFLQTLFSHHKRKDISRRSDTVDADHCGECCGLFCGLYPHMDVTAPCLSHYYGVNDM